MSEAKWNDGWPRQQGWYKCLLDGELEMNLKYYVCQVSMKPHWVDANGDYNNPPSPAYWYKNWILGMKSLGFSTKEQRRKIFEYIIQIIDMEVRDCE